MNKNNKIKTPKHRHPNGTGNPFKGKNRAQRGAVQSGFSAMATHRAPGRSDSLPLDPLGFMLAAIASAKARARRGSNRRKG